MSKTMSKRLKVVETAAAEVPPKVADFAQKSVDQAQAAFDKASDLAHSHVQHFDAAAGAFKARAADIQLKTMEIAQINMNSAFTFMRKVFAAKDPAEFAVLQQDFVRDQFAAYSRQAGELNELAVLLAQETVKPVRDGVLKSFGDFSKSVA
ncbi:MAG: phasin family protein [Parvibaculaceae bacterium]